MPFSVIIILYYYYYDMSVCLPILYGRILMFDMICKLSARFSVPGMCIGTIGLYERMPHLVALTMAEGNKFSRLHISQLIRLKFDAVLKQFRLNTLVLLQEIYAQIGNNCSFTLCLGTLPCWCADGHSNL